ncbi:MAG: hypothetical protein ABR502_12350, partial [Chitinophagaceae bacterium]
VFVRARSSNRLPAKIKLTLITKDAHAFSASVSINKEWQEIGIPLNSLHPDSFLLLPRPYPRFLPLFFKAATPSELILADVEKLEVSFGSEVTESDNVIEIESVWLTKWK